MATDEERKKYKDSLTGKTPEELKMMLDKSLRPWKKGVINNTLLEIAAKNKNELAEKHIEKIGQRNKIATFANIISFAALLISVIALIRTF